MTARRRRTGLRITAVAVLAAAALVGLAPSPASAAGVAPSAIGWWDETRQTAAQPSSQTDVPAGGGLVSGVDPSAALSTLPLPAGTAPELPPQQTAETALNFTLPVGAVATSLTLQVTSSPTGTVSSAAGDAVAAPLACLVTNAWVPVQGGVWSDRAMPDCSTRSAFGADDGTTLTFPDIGHLQQGQALDIVILPGAAERTVIAPPAANALQTVTYATASYAPTGSSNSASTFTTAPTPVSRARPTRRAPVAVVAPSTPPRARETAAPAVGGSSAGGTGPGLSAPAAVPVPTVSPAGALPTPGIGTGSGATTLQPPAPVAAASQASLARPLASHRSALLLSLLLLLVLTLLLVSRDSDVADSGLAGAAALIRGRPLPTRADDADTHGLGRFRRERTGRPDPI